MLGQNFFFHDAPYLGNIYSDKKDTHPEKEIVFVQRKVVQIYESQGTSINKGVATVNLTVRYALYDESAFLVESAKKSNIYNKTIIIEAIENSGKWLVTALR